MDNNKIRKLKRQLQNKLEVMDKEEFKLFYSILVHYWVNYRIFLSRMNFFYMWCELNKLCHEVDENFPDQYENHKAVRDFCVEHPFYFVDILDLRVVKSIFWRYIHKDLEVINIALRKLHREGLRAAYEYINWAMDLKENIDELVKETEKNMEEFS